MLKPGQRANISKIGPEVVNVTPEKIEQTVQNALGYSRMRLAGELQRMAEQQVLNPDAISKLVNAVEVNGRAMHGSIGIMTLIQQAHAEQHEPVAADVPSPS